MTTEKHNFAPLYRAFILLCLFCAFSRPSEAAVTADSSSAVIFLYQRVGEDTLPQGNLSLDRFQEHIRELTTGGYSVLPLPEIIAAIREDKPLPEKTVGITFEGAYLATLKNALPLLDEAKLPFTVFFSSDMADGGNPSHMTWDQLKDLKKDGLASFGLLPSAYTHMADLDADRAAALINKARSRYTEMMGESAVFFSWPYGEYSSALKKQLATYDFKASFGQQSGVVYAGSDFTALPRFTMTDAYGDLDRFLLTANALALPVSEVVPDDTLIAENPPIIGFTVAPEITNLGELSCFGSSLGKIAVTRLGNRIEMRPDQPFEDRRTRINCTLPESTVIPGESQRWRWFGMILIAKAISDEQPPEPADAPATEESPKAPDASGPEEDF